MSNLLQDNPAVSEFRETSPSGFPFSVVTYSNRERQCRKWSRCWSRTCLTCQRFRCQALRKRVVEQQAQSHCYLVTLTKRVQYQRLKFQLDRLRQDFLKLRERRVWRDHVLGGVYAIHLVGQKRPDRWFPHVHMVASVRPNSVGVFEEIPLDVHWADVTEGSDNVLVQKVTNTEEEPWRLINYVVRPVFEPFRDNGAMMDEFSVETRGTPLVGMLGDWRGLGTVIAEED